MLRMITLLLALGASANAIARCEYPAQLENLPNGETASKEDMLNGQKSVKVYMEEMNGFLECLAKEDEALGDAEETAEQRNIIAQRHNAAVDQMEATGEEFNQAVRAYKARINN